MFGIGTGELLLLLVIALIVLGPERLPGIARDLGKVMNDLRRTSDELTGEFMRADQAPPRRVEASATPSEPATPKEPAPTIEPVADEPPSGEEPTSFDEEAQRRADEARSQAEATQSWKVAEEHPEPDRWG